MSLHPYETLPSTNMEPDLVRNHDRMFELLETEEEIRNFLRLNATSLRLLKKHLHVLAKNLGEKNKYESQITKLQGLQTKAKIRLQRTTIEGAGLDVRGRKNKRSDRVQWVDLKSAFQSRIRTGAVINLKHKFPETFLPDAMFLIKTRFQNILKTGQNIKVNFELSCRYELSRTAEIEDKFFNTPNIPLHPAVDLDPILEECCQTLKTKVSCPSYLHNSEMSFSFNDVSMCVCVR